MRLAIAVLFLATTTTAAAQQTINFNVTTSADAGAGSLRDVIERANVECYGAVPCEIRFAAPFAPIELEMPLPAIATCGRLTIGAGGELTQLPPVVELNGAHLTSGDGLEVRSRCPNGPSFIEIRRMAIRGFPDAAVGMRASVGRPEVTVSASTIEANGRGIVIDDDSVSARIHDNVISGNVHSGIFAWAARDVTIENNTIESNGASGIFIGRAIARIHTNTIAFNRDFGIAVSRLSPQCGATRNSIFENGWLGIDWELNGRIDDDIPDDAPMPRAPVLTDARVDPVTKETVVRGIVHAGTRPGPLLATIHIYKTPASRSHAEGETEVFAFPIPPRVGPIDVPFEFRLSRRIDVSDSILTVQYALSYSFEEGDQNTSEFSNGVRVH